MDHSGNRRGRTLLLVLGLAAVAIKAARRARLRTGSDRSTIARFPKPAGAMPNRGSVTSIEARTARHPSSVRVGAGFLEDWRHAEARFVDDPRTPLAQRSEWSNAYMPDRGYPTDADTEAQAAHVAVDHPGTATATRSSSRSTAVRTRRTCGKR